MKIFFELTGVFYSKFSMSFFLWQRVIFLGEFFVEEGSFFGASRKKCVLVSESFQKGNL